MQGIQIDFIDSCVWIDPYQKEVEDYSNYLNLIGYKSKNVQRNIGVITVPVLGEIKAMIITKIQDEGIRIKMSQNIIKIISRLREGGKLRVYRFRNVNDKSLEEIRNVDYKITEDDALHICEAINIGYQNFITTDKFLLENSQLTSWLGKHKKLKIRKPY